MVDKELTEHMLNEIMASPEMIELRGKVSEYVSVEGFKKRMTAFMEEEILQTSESRKISKLNHILKQVKHKMMSEEIAIKKIMKMMP